VTDRQWLDQYVAADPTGRKHSAIISAAFHQFRLQTEQNAIQQNAPGTTPANQNATTATD
jgi:hypothetical protein